MSDTLFMIRYILLFHSIVGQSPSPVVITTPRPPTKPAIPSILDAPNNRNQTVAVAFTNATNSLSSSASPTDVSVKNTSISNMSTSLSHDPKQELPTADNAKDVPKAPLIKNTTSSSISSNKSDDAAAKISSPSPSNQTKPENVTSKLIPQSASPSLEKNVSLPKLTVEKVLHPSLKNQSEVKEQSKEGIFM